MMGPQGLAFGTYVATMDHNKDINISKDHIMVMGKVNDKVEFDNSRTGCITSSSKAVCYTHLTMHKLLLV